MASDKDLQFYTGFSYLKRFLYSSQKVTVPGSFGHVGGNTIPHNLGYLPAVRMFFSVDDKVFPFTGAGSIGGPILDTYKEGIYGNYVIDETNITYALNNTGASDKDVIVYYIIYLDEIPS